MTRLNAKRYIAVYPKDHKHALTLVVQDSRAGWVARLLDNRTPNEAEPLELFSGIVLDPKAGKKVLERELKDFLRAENWPQMPISWI
jgi:hypothetical protein